MYLLVKLYSVHVTVHYLFEMYICSGLRVHFFFGCFTNVLQVYSFVDLPVPVF